MSRRWVADASPIILLAKAGRPGLLSAPTEDLLVPAVVAEEVRQGPPEDLAREWLGEVGDRFVEATGPVESEIAAWDLGRGESRVLSVACRREEWTAVVMDCRCRRWGSAPLRSGTGSSNGWDAWSFGGGQEGRSPRRGRACDRGTSPGGTPRKRCGCRSGSAHGRRVVSRGLWASPLRSLDLTYRAEKAKSPARC